MRSRLISGNTLLAVLLACIGWFSSPFWHLAVASPKPPDQTQSKRSQWPFSLTLAAPKQPAKSGEPVILLATVTNTSTQLLMMSFSFGSDDVEEIYQVHILDERGQPVPRRPQPKGLLWGGSVLGMGLNTGQSKEDQLNLSYTYDLSRPGKYKIWVVRYGRSPMELVVSNTVTVTVVPVPPFTLSLETPQQTLKAGQALLLKVNVTNTSESALDVPISEGIFGVGKIYQVGVHDERGRLAQPAPPPAPTEKGETRVRAGGSVPSHPLKPEESFVDLVNVTDIYNLSQPGKYEISVGEPYGSGPDRGLVESNTVTVTVIK